MLVKPPVTERHRGLMQHVNQRSSTKYKGSTIHKQRLLLRPRLPKRYVASSFPVCLANENIRFIPDAAKCVKFKDVLQEAD